jgi:hypothetical protein
MAFSPAQAKMQFGNAPLSARLSIAGLGDQLRVLRKSRSSDWLIL